MSILRAVRGGKIMLKEIEIYNNLIILRDENGKIIERLATDKPVVKDRRRHFYLN